MRWSLNHGGVHDIGLICSCMSLKQITKPGSHVITLVCTYQYEISLGDDGRLLLIFNPEEHQKKVDTLRFDNHTQHVVAASMRYVHIMKTKRAYLF